MQSGLQHRPVTAGLGVEPVALQNAVVQRGVGVRIRLERLVERLERCRPVSLAPVRREQGPILAVVSVADAPLGKVMVGDFRSAVDSDAYAS
jgi:hypothetical protein